MAQKITNSARSFLQGSITAASTSLVIEAPKADLFPVANTNTDAVNTVGKDWFKIVLQDTAGNREIAYVRTRAAGVATLSNVIRGQEGTTALDFPAGSVVGLRITALDIEKGISLAAITTAYAEALLAAADAAAARAAISALSTTEKAASAQVADRVLTGAAGGTSNAITATFSPNVTALTDGLRVRVTGLSPNTSTAPTLAAGTTAATVIKGPQNTALNIGDIPFEADFTYSSAAAAWILNNPVPCVVGTVQSFAMSSAPAGWLKANGAAVSRTAYAALFAVIGTTYGAGDGSTTFGLPDLRGEFIRGWDDGRGVDTGRVFGTAQSDAFQGHWHATTLYQTNAGGGTGIGTAQNTPVVATSSITDPTPNDVNGTPRTASETRPRNVAMLACIKF